HTRSKRDWSSDVCSSDLTTLLMANSGILTLSNAVNTFGGGLIISNGTVSIAGGGVLGTGNVYLTGGMLNALVAVTINNPIIVQRSEERRVGKECRSRWCR